VSADASYSVKVPVGGIVAYDAGRVGQWTPETVSIIASHCLTTNLVGSFTDGEGWSPSGILALVCCDVQVPASCSVASSALSSVCLALHAVWIRAWQHSA
jgi:hypothetical protein